MAGHVVVAISVAIVRNGQVLLVRRGREPAKGMFALPGGRVESGETLEEAARRELLEETGLLAQKLAQFDTLDIAPADPEKSGYRLHVFAGEVESGNLRAGDDADTAGWYRLSDLKGMPVTAGTREICKRLPGLSIKQS